MKMMKAELVMLYKDSKYVFEILQKYGFIEIENIKNDSLLKFDGIYSLNTFENNISEAENSLDILNKYIKKGFLEMFEAREFISNDEFNKKKDRLKDTLKTIKNINKYSEKIIELKNDIKSLEIKSDTLNFIKNYPIPQNLKSTEKTKIISGTITKENENILKSYESEILFYKKIINETKDTFFLLIICTYMQHPKE